MLIMSDVEVINKIIAAGYGTLCYADGSVHGIVASHLQTVPV